LFLVRRDPLSAKNAFLRFKFPVAEAEQKNMNRRAELVLNYSRRCLRGGKRVHCDAFFGAKVLQQCTTSVKPGNEQYQMESFRTRP
jgi:hypothetical protein